MRGKLVRRRGGVIYTSHTTLWTREGVVLTYTQYYYIKR